MLPLLVALLLPGLTGPIQEPTPPSVDDVEDSAAALTDDLKDQADAALAEEEEKDKGWEGAFTLSASKTYGNTDIQTFALGLDSVLDRKPDRYSVKLAHNYSDEDGQVIQRRNMGEFQYDRFLSDKSYLLANATAMSDFLANVDLRWTAGLGYGYQFRDDDVWKIAGEAGISYFNEEFGDGTENDYVAARLAYNWEYNHSEDWIFSQSGEIFPSLEDEDDIYALIDTRVKATLTEAMFAQLQWIFNWDNTPATDGNGNLLDREDHILLLSVGWSF